jgi:hypothetical protein
MAETKEKAEEIAITEGQDGSATVILPENMVGAAEEGEENADPVLKADGGAVSEEDTDHPDDDEELRQAKRNRRRAKKELIRKTNQEKDARLTSLQRENEEFKRRLSQLERNTKSEQVTRIDKGIEDANVRLEYAKMKLAEATDNNDGQAMVEAQTLWQNAQDEVRNLNYMRQQADQELRKSQDNREEPTVDPEVKRLASNWVAKNKWYNPAGTDHDSRIAKKIDELMSAQGWNPTDPDYWEELDSRLQKELPHRYNDDNDDETRNVRRPRNIVGSAGREVSAAYGGSNRTQFVLSPDRVKAMKEVGAWDNPERKARMIQQFINYDRQNGRRN